jgi:hypothetical protein
MIAAKPSPLPTWADGPSGALPAPGSTAAISYIEKLIPTPLITIKTYFSVLLDSNMRANSVSRNLSFIFN